MNKISLLNLLLISIVLQSTSIFAMISKEEMMGLERQAYIERFIRQDRAAKAEKRQKRKNQEKNLYEKNKNNELQNLQTDNPIVVGFFNRYQTLERNFIENYLNKDQESSELSKLLADVNKLFDEICMAKETNKNISSELNKIALAVLSLISFIKKVQIILI